MSGPVDTPRLAPFARFSTVFGWGLRRTLRTRKFQVTLGLAVLAGAGLGLFVADKDDRALALWEFVNDGMLGIAVPLIALGVVAGGFAEEVQDQTLVWHLVRPVSRTTVFLARFASGLACGVVATVPLVLAGVLTSGVDLPLDVHLVIVGAAVLGTCTVGALYYALAALFRRGLVAGLVYTFVVEFFFQQLPGSVQKLGLTHHVRSLFHRLADSEFAARSRAVAKTVAKVGTVDLDQRTLRVTAQEPWSSPGSAVLVCAIVAAVALFLGARQVRDRDFALKD